MIYSKSKNYTLYLGKMEDELSNIDDNSIGSIVTDPPYELGFMGKSWDSSGVAFQKSTWEHCYRVLKPGGYLLAFGGSRTYHRIACAIEDAGFEIRDTVMWLYGSGFPKSMNIGLAIDKKNGVESQVVGKGKLGKEETHSSSLNMVKGGFGGEYEIKEVQNEWQGWGTALKPSFEPIIVARKPFKGSLVDNVIEYGVGGINIDECRVEAETNRRMCGTTEKSGETSFILGTRKETYTSQGRFPANTILTYDETDFDEVCGGFPDTGSGNGGEPYNYSGKEYHNRGTSMFNGDKPQSCSNYNDSGSASRYFYCAKASKKDRDEGLEEFEDKQKYYCDGRGNSLEIFGKTDGGRKPLKNIHPTVKPTELMQYLIRLVTPKGETVLDPFMGSGSTGKAVMFENNERNANYKFIGVEMTEEYLPICKKRIEFAQGYVSIDEIDDKKVAKTPTCVKESLW